MPYSAWPYFRSLNPTPYLNLTTTLLTINKFVLGKRLVNSEYVFPILKSYPKTSTEQNTV